MNREKTLAILGEVGAERERQHAQWGTQRLADGTGGRGAEEWREVVQRDCNAAFAGGIGTWRHVLEEEVAEVFAETDAARLRAELLQVAAVAVQWVECLDVSEGKP